MSKRVAAGAVGIGAVLGSVGRKLPTAVVDLASRGGPAHRATAGCRWTAPSPTSPGCSGDAILFGHVVGAVTAMFAFAGAASAAFGLVRLRRAATGDGQDSEPSPTIADPIGLGLLVVGAALVTPAIWLAGSFAVFMAG